MSDRCPIAEVAIIGQFARRCLQKDPYCSALTTASPALAAVDEIVSFRFVLAEDGNHVAAETRKVAKIVKFAGIKPA
jgi:hypothetical protein